MNYRNRPTDMEKMSDVLTQFVQPYAHLAETEELRKIVESYR
jgi:hypothetical protein